MVLLTYEAETVFRDQILRDKDSISKNDCPKTAYIDKLCAFNEDYADEERCDLFFICQDGEIPAHRLVISNASKLIMAMQDDQPPWFPVYISVPDLSTEIVKTLVRLAYTGQMNIPPGTTSDELLDAMQTLGWVHTDCLTATYLDGGASADDEFGASVSTKTAESLETVLKMSFPVTNKNESEASDDDDEMEMALPDVPMSDEEEVKLEATKVLGKKKDTDMATKSTRRTKPSKSPSPSKCKPVSTSKRRQSPKPAKQKESPIPSEPTSNSRKNSRKATEDNVNSNTIKDNKQSDSTPVPGDGDSEPVRSRTRTIRKPKKFDDLIVMTPTKRKDSPTKSPSKAAPKNIKVNDIEKEVEETEVANTSRKGTANKKGTKGDTNTERTGSKSRKSASLESNSLITSYFNKRSPRKSNDIATLDAESINDNGNDSMAEVNNVQNTDTDTNTDSVGVEDGDSNNATDDRDTKGEMRKRARSTTSTKSDKDTSKDGSSIEAETPSKTRRKRNQGSVEVDSVDVAPTKRGRKASTVSNASKSSTKDALTVNDVEDKDTLRKTRSRHE